MKLTVLDEGVIWKNPHAASRPRVALKGNSVCLGGGAILHGMQVGQARASRDSRCMLVRSSDYGKTWSAMVPLVEEDGRDARYTYFSPRLRRASDSTLWACFVRARLVEPEDPRWTRQNAGWV